MNGKEYDDIVDFLDSDGVLVPKEVYCSSNPDKSEQEFRRKVKDYELTSEYELPYQDVRIVVPEDRMKLYIMLCHQPIIPHPTVHHSEDETYRIANSALFWPSKYTSLYKCFNGLSTIVLNVKKNSVIDIGSCLCSWGSF